MNRCPSTRNRVARRLFGLPAAVLIGLGCAGAPAQAQDNPRPFPATARAGYLEVTAPPNVLINGQAARLAPGARIKNTQNLLVLSGTLVGQHLPVQYTRDPFGLIHEVWLLSTAEAQRADMPTLTNIVFGADAAQPKTDDGRTPFDQLPRFPSQ